jgi:hypothetical protein
MENRYIELIAIKFDNNFIYFKIGKQTCTKTRQFYPKSIKNFVL